MKKILFIGLHPTGGINTFIVNVFLHLKDKYKCEFIYTSKKPLSLARIITKNGGVINYINMPHNIFKYFVRYHYAKKFFKENHDYDLIDLNATTINNIFWIKAAKKYGINNFIIHSHIDSCDDSRSTLYRIMSRFLVISNRHYLYKHSDIYKLAASVSCGKWMFGNNSQFKVIANGVDTNVFKPSNLNRKIVREKLDISANDKVLITTSRLEPVKNYPKIINIFSKIQKHLSNAKLLILGTGSEMHKIQNLVKSYNLTNNVFFLGNESKSNVIRCLDAADLMLMPSFYEGLPFSLIEAQSAGVPALVSTEIPKESNITNEVYYLSLDQSNEIWYKCAMNILYKNNNNKLKMNDDVNNSPFNLINSLRSLKLLYCNIINK